MEELSVFNNEEEMMSQINEDLKNKNTMDYQDASFYELNEYIKEWVLDYETQIKEAFKDKEKEEVDSEAYEKAMVVVENVRERNINEEYVKGIEEYLDTIDLSFLENYDKIKEHNALFLAFIQDTCDKKGVDYKMFTKLVKTNIQSIAESRREEKVFGAFCYLITKEESVNKNLETQYKFIKLFLSSMVDTYGKKVFKKIIKLYNDYTSKNE